ncbi:MAG TPA: S-methyl-5-thioribose-1-phosphate isomerase [Pseudonocardia sp.]|uniref:S-methyl-5-thioribose-1-phosphate isomerase n=1 Tax=Pseudonocardia sp. TaxID=60912 RepID=UPI002B4B6EAF|nr:S-methyl-5-thioribose-1-phosphate isomerase [Pseudonocardia sp.]HLU59886.1 S-methyl-5-thioribose-1-phosphate isomerase [Pseudonocardia sp.]
MAVRTVEWLDEPVPAVRLLDQTRLPAEEVYLTAADVDTLVDAIARLAVRGAPALGAAGALGVAVALGQGAREGWDDARLRHEISRLRDARPTAVNLAWAVDRVAAFLPDGPDAVLAEARRVLAEDEAANRALSAQGADWLLRRCPDRPLRVLTHCNTGTLATTAWGTALGVVRELHARGRLELVHVDETRPLLQGSRLTAWELRADGIDHVVQVDSAAAGAILRGLVDAVVIGADRIAANGDTANKVGSVGLALACADAGIPFVVAAPWSTVDLATPDGTGITIEERAPDEVVAIGGVPIAPAGSRVFNPAFDVTPARLIDAIVTERGVAEPKVRPDMTAVQQPL